MENIKLNKVYVSFTSLPERFNNIENLYNQLNNQTIKPDKVYLWIPYSYRRSSTKIIIPKFLETQDLIEVKRCEDIGPITKIYYSLLDTRIGMDDIIISIDDDMNFNTTFIENLITASRKLPEACIGHRGRIFRNNKLIYNQTKIIRGKLKTLKKVDLVLGVDGVLYKKKFFNKEFFNIDVENAFYVDDIWINGNLAKNNIHRYIVGNELTKTSKYVNVNSLYSLNRNAKYNDELINHFQKYFIS